MITTYDMGFSFSEAEMNAAFSAVQNKENWKYPIEAEIEASEMAVTAEAIIFYTGGAATFSTLAGGKLLVRAPGYYASVGS